MKLNKYDMSHNWLTAFRIGQLMPTMLQEVTPGEVWHGQSTIITRLDPLNKPTYMSLKVFNKTFYLPYRILDENFPEWWAGRDGGSYEFPQWNIGNTHISEVDMHQAFGMMTATARPNHNICAFGLRAYNMIWNKHFRQSGINEVDLDTVMLHRVSHPSGNYLGNMRMDMQVGNAIEIDTSGGSITIPEVRDKWALQRLQEHRELYGDKYIDQLRRFGVAIPYGLVDEPVPVASGKGVIGISEVVETATTTESTSGQMTGHGIVAHQVNMKPRRFLEPGLLMQVSYARPRLSLAQYVDRIHMKSADDGTSVYQPELALQSDATVKSDEIYMLSTVNNTDYAYVDNYEWLRSARDVVAGAMQKTEYGEFSSHKRLGALPTLDNLQYVDDYDALFQNAASGTRADVQILNAHRLKKLSPVRRKGRS